MPPAISAFENVWQFREGSQPDEEVVCFLQRPHLQLGQDRLLKTGSWEQHPCCFIPGPQTFVDIIPTLSSLPICPVNDTNVQCVLTACLSFPVPVPLTDLHTQRNYSNSLPMLHLLPKL